jgi:hypothetical protein
MYERGKKHNFGKIVLHHVTGYNREVNFLIKIKDFSITQRLSGVRKAISWKK